MSIEKNKSVSKRHYEEVLSGKRLDVIDEIYAPVIELDGGQSISREQFKAMAKMSMEAFPDLTATIITQLAEGNAVATYWKASGTHGGAFIDMPATGRKVELRTMHIHEIENGRITKLYESFDMYGLRQQLGFK